FTEWMPRLRGQRVAVIDGSDRVEPYPFAGRWWRMPRWWLVPRAHRGATFFKREITPMTYWFATYLLVPGRLARRLGVLRGMRPLAFSIPEEKILDEPPPKDKLLASHVVDEEVAARMGGSTGYAFSSEEEYFADLRRSRYGITTKRAGWDALRHYEMAANGCVPCFRALERKPPLCAPHGLDETNCVPYADARDLEQRLARIDDQRYAELQAGALAWARANSTTERARQFLETVGLPLRARAAAAV
ncbi:MAG: glycosyltransferase family 1 protein, partial [Actinomycetota bacterium]|nr:glycosyltransferase family 1 protein [Actinomycetota bacterium]